MAKNEPLKIGLSARLLYPDPRRSFLPTKTLQYLEQSVANWVMSAEVLSFMIPAISYSAPHFPQNLTVKDYVDMLDGLVMQGGADMAPETYGETPINPEWSGDRVRDLYEIELFQEFVKQGKPVLGICRGCQLINVAFGGTLYQDIETQLPNTLEHWCDKRYEHNFHDVKILPGTSLAKLYPEVTLAKINTIHHQAVKDLGKDLIVEASSDPDNMVEAVRWAGPSYVRGVQWHPEFMDPKNTTLLSGRPILDEFIGECRKVKDGVAQPVKHAKAA
jgi:putative glutamine amidotransferase